MKKGKSFRVIREGVQGDGPSESDPRNLKQTSATPGVSDDTLVSPGTKKSSGKPSVEGTA